MPIGLFPSQIITLPTSSFFIILAASKTVWFGLAVITLATIASFILIPVGISSFSFLNNLKIYMTNNR